MLKKPQTISKAAIIKRASKLSGVPIKYVRPAMDGIFQAIKDAVEEGETVNVAGFGKFYYQLIKGGRIVNPGDGEVYEYNDRLMCRFRNSEVFTKQLNKGANGECDPEELDVENDEKEGVLEIYD
jgi:nucleoid DNA-binding protein